MAHRTDCTTCTAKVVDNKMHSRVKYIENRIKVKVMKVKVRSIAVCNITLNATEIHTPAYGMIQR